SVRVSSIALYRYPISPAWLRSRDLRLPLRRDVSRGGRMQLDKQFVLDELKKEGESQKAQQALAGLPEKIDHEQHAALLEKFGLDPGKLAEKAAELGNASL